MLNCYKYVKGEKFSDILIFNNWQWEIQTSGLKSESDYSRAVNNANEVMLQLLCVFFLQHLLWAFISNGAVTMYNPRSKQREQKDCLLHLALIRFPVTAEQSLETKKC